jgi:hypothetical protein
MCCGGMRWPIGAALAAALLLTALVFAVRDSGERGGTPAIANCTGAERIDFGCYQRRYRAMVAVRGPRAAIRDLSARSTRVGYLRAACHQLMHGIGRDAGRRRGIAAFDQGDESCSSGYFHGVVEAVMARLGPTAVRRDADRVCAAFRKSRRAELPLYNCVHGMGHGFMELNAGDVFASLDGCGALQSRWERRHCEGGVFMQNLTAMADPRQPSRQLRPRQPLYPCTAVAARYKHECYMKQTAYALYVHDDDFGAVFRLCAASPDVAFRDDCFQGVGGDASIRASKYVTGPAAKRATVRALCRLGGGPAARRNCVEGAVTVIVRDGATQATNPVAFCASFAEAGLRAACSRAHLRTARQLTRGGSERVAATGESPRMLCQTAARLETTSAGQGINRGDLR